MPVALPGVACNAPRPHRANIFISVCMQRLANESHLPSSQRPQDIMRYAARAMIDRYNVQFVCMCVCVGLNFDVLLAFLAEEIVREFILRKLLRVNMRA